MAISRIVTKRSSLLSYPTYCPVETPSHIMDIHGSPQKKELHEIESNRARGHSCLSSPVCGNLDLDRSREQLLERRRKLEQRTSARSRRRSRLSRIGIKSSQQRRSRAGNGIPLHHRDRRL